MNCKGCLSKNTKFLFKKNDFNLYQCLKCNLVFSGKVYSDKEIEEIYSESYYKNLKNFNRITDKRYFSVLEYLSSYSEGRRLLDIGCGTGQFLLAAKRKGWDVSGVEISDSISQWSRQNLGLDIKCVDFLKIDFSDNHFDAVTMFESLEHFGSPNTCLSKINSILRNKGVLFITTPNFISLSRRLLGKKWRVFSEEHILYFSPPILKRILEDSGFTVIKCITKNICLSELKNIFFRYNDANQYMDNEEKLREQVENSNILRFSKNIINYCLNLFQLGDSIWIFAQKVKEIR